MVGHTEPSSRPTLSLETSHPPVVPEEAAYTAAATTDASEKGKQQHQQPPVQVYVRIRPLIDQEKGHPEMEYKIVSSVDNDDEDEDEDDEQPKKGNDDEMREVELHVKIPGKKRAMNPAFHQKLQQQQQEVASSLLPSTSENPTPPPEAPPLPPPRFLRQGRDDWKVYKGMTKILDQHCTNEMVYRTTIQPVLLQQVLRVDDNHNNNNHDSPKYEDSSSSSSSSSLCVFTYGHTGSGKSHTLLGYDDKKDSLGIYKYAVNDLFHQLKVLDDVDAQKDSNGHQQQYQPNRMTLIRITELYKDNIRDLLTGDDCTIRENKHGVAKIRGPMVEDSESGMIDQKPLGRLCSSASEAIQCIDDACTARRVGISTHHDQSSRSHLVMELEIVTEPLVEQRDLVVKQETHLTRLMWLQTERSFGKHLGRAMPEWTNAYTSGGMKLRHEIKEYESLVNESQIKLRQMEVGQTLLGTTVVFCDLAGNEYAKDSTGSTKEEMEEAANINRSLLSVKEMIRSLKTYHHVNKSSKGENTRKAKTENHHVNYRDSKLSMVLRRHVQIQRPKQGKGGSAHTSYAIMLGHMSPSQQYLRKTLNTLTYCQLVGYNGNDKVKKKNSNKKGNEEKSASKKRNEAVTAASATPHIQILVSDNKKDDGKENKP